MAFNPDKTGSSPIRPLPTAAQKQDNGPHPVDVHVGLRLRQRRTLLGMTQEKLGEALGLTFQQVQKYERGTNRIGASRLFHLSQLLIRVVGLSICASGNQSGYPQVRNAKGDFIESDSSN